VIVSLEQFAAFSQVVLADLVLAGDNAVAVGVAASGLAPQRQRQAILIGIVLALVLRILFALVAIQLLALKGLLLVGGLLLLWVAWRMWRDLEGHGAAETATGAAAAGDKPASFLRALITIIVADVSMSLDNVLVVAGVARDHPMIMAFGLVLSVLLMGLAAGLIARVIQRYRWIALFGVIIIVFAAIRMIWEELHVFFPALVPAMPGFLGGGGHG
jgi:YjbE family integral membrane protein